MDCTLPQSALDRTLSRLDLANRQFEARYSGAPRGRQPVHTVYGGAHLFNADTPRKLASLAARALDEYAPDAGTFAGALGVPMYPAFERIYDRVRQKLSRDAVEDLRIDFEDGYGIRSEAEEDAHCLSVARELARGSREGTLPAFVGVRIKSLGRGTAARALRTLDLMLSPLARETGGALPSNFVVTLPKVVIPEQVSALVQTLDALEAALGLSPGSVGIELMVEASQSLVSATGAATLATLLDASMGRCRAAHLGAYDYTASVEVSASDQSLAHPWCDHARHAMQLAFAGTGVRLSDGATTELPVGPHRAPASAEEREANRAAVYRAWALAHANITRALTQGFYQGWDLHPAQLPPRYAAVYGFFEASREAAGARLRNFVARAARATLVGCSFDDAATGQGLVNFFLRAVDSGAFTEDEAAEAAGVSVAAMRTRSFAAMIGAAR